MRNATVWSLSGTQRHNCIVCIHMIQMHLRYPWWINWDISLVRQILKQGGFISINIVSSTILDICGDVTWRKWNSDIHQDQAETSHIQFFLDKQEPWSRRTCNVLMASSPNFTHTLHENGYSYKFLVSTKRFWISPFGLSSLSAMERREDSRQRMLGSLLWIDSQFVGLCAEL